MKISKLDTKTPQDEGAFMHMTSPKFGHLMYTGPNADDEGRWTSEDQDPDPEAAVGLMVRGMEAQSVQEFTRAQQRKALTNAKKTNPTPQSDIDHENGIKFACVLITDFVNIEDEAGDPLEPTEENKRWLIAMSDDISRQLLKFARDQDNFFDKPSSD